MRVRGPRTTTGRLYHSSAGGPVARASARVRTAVCWCGVSPYLCVCGVLRPRARARVLARVQLNVTIQRQRMTTRLNLAPHHAVSNREKL